MYGSITDDYADLFREASAYAQRNIASSQSNAEKEAQQRMWLLVGGAGAAALLLVILLMRKQS